MGVVAEADRRVGVKRVNRGCIYILSSPFIIEIYEGLVYNWGNWC